VANVSLFLGPGSITSSSGIALVKELSNALQCIRWKSWANDLVGTQKEHGTECQCSYFHLEMEEFHL